jgi:ABC-type amino acid transport substrate-binding protein
MRALLGAVGVILALAWAPAAQAEPREIVVGVEELDYLPDYGMRDGQYGGAAREILDAFAKDRGYHVVYRPRPIKRLTTELVTGEIDLKFPDNPLWAPEIKQDAPVAYSQPVIRHVDGTFVAAASRGAPVRVLGTIGGFTPVSWGEALRSGRVQLKETNQMETLLRQVAAGRIDGAYVSVSVGLFRLREAGLDGQVVYDPALPKTPSAYMLSSVRQPALIAEFDAWMASHTALLKAIKARYGSEQGLD